MRWIKGTPFCVDYFHAPRNANVCVTHYFLTHTHGDHVSGLCDRWSHGPLYCSEASKQLIRRRFDIDGSLFHIIESGQSICIQLAPKTNGQTMNVTSERQQDSCVRMNVTAVGANHCAGALMYIFESYFGVFLHTGDFRCNEAMVDRRRSPLRSYVERIDRLILDNTFCDRKFDFGSRDEALRDVFALLDEHFVARRRDVIVGIDSLGKEELLVAVAERYRTRVVVSAERFDVVVVACRHWLGIDSDEQIYKRFVVVPHDSDVLGSRSEPAIRVVSKRSVSQPLLDRCNRYRRTVALLPTAYALPSMGTSRRIFHISYSLHSSFPELVAFVRFLRPRFIEANVSRSHADMSIFDALLSPIEPHRFVVPAVLLRDGSGGGGGTEEVDARVVARRHPAHISPDFGSSSSSSSSSSSESDDDDLATLARSQANYDQDDADMVEFMMALSEDKSTATIFGGSTSLAHQRLAAHP
jgi:DNA repair metallo-beta-lactamase